MKSAAIQLMVLMAVFTVLEGRWPSTRAHKWWRRPLIVDLCSWMLHPLSMAAGISLAIAITNGMLAKPAHEGLWLTFWTLREHMSALPFAAQSAIAVLMADFLEFWIHRAYHRFPALWAFHIMHHTSEELDWLSTSRLHPLSQLLNTALVGGVLLLMGIPVTAIVVANVLIGAAALLVHANVRWTFGPFQHLLVSPLFHQWHHARVDAAAQRHDIGNFGAIFSIWDRLFGTWSLPAQRPEHFGVQEMPGRTILDLLLYPFRRLVRFLQASLGGSDSAPGPKEKFTTSEARSTPPPA